MRRSGGGRGRSLSSDSSRNGRHGGAGEDYYAILPVTGGGNDGIDDGRGISSAPLLDRSRPTEEDFQLHTQELDCRLNVFREFLCVARLPHPPRYYDARPTHFPPQVNVFLTGALYVAVHKMAMMECTPLYNQVYMCLFMSLLILYLVVSWGTPGLFETTENGHTRFRMVSYACHAAVIYVLSMTVAFYLTRPVMKKLHDRMDDVVQELSPLFRKVGYDLEYHVSEPSRTGAADNNSSAWWSRLNRICDRQSFVRIVPYSGRLTPEEEAQANAQWDPQRRQEQEAVAFGEVSEAAVTTTAVEADGGSGGFKVAVSGAQTYPGQVGHGRDPNFLFISWLDKLGTKIDGITWGAVATEMRPFTDRYQSARQWSILVVVASCMLPVSMPDAFSSWYVTVPFIVTAFGLFAVTYYPCAAEVWWLNKVFGVPDLDGMHAAIQRLSPLVEERTGYTLRLNTEPEGRWGGRSTFVYFEPRIHGLGAGAAMSLSASMA